MKFELKTTIFAKKVNVQEAGQYVFDQRNNRVSDNDLVEDNKTKDRPLYKLFTWNDKKAASKLRIQELKKFEQQLVIIDETQPTKLKEQPAIVRVPEKLVKKGGSGLRTVAVTIKEVCSNEDMMNYVVHECKTELREVVRKFNKFVALQKHLNKIEKIIESI